MLAEEDCQTFFSINRFNEKNGENTFLFNLCQNVRKNGPPDVADRRQRAMKDIQGLANDRPDNT